VNKSVFALLANGSLFRDPGPYGDLFGILGPYWVSIYFSGALFSVFWLDSREECQFSLHVYNTGSGLHCPKILIFTYASRVDFHKSSFWVLILAAGGPY